MKVITISNLKGGVGKTTSAVNLAFSLSLMGKRILLIDADPQANLTPFFAKANQYGTTIRDALYLSGAGQSIKRCIKRSRYPGISIIRGDTGLTEEEGIHMEGLMKEIVCSGMEDTYDFCIIDTRPAFENITSSAIVGSDLILTPVCLDKFCRDNLGLVDEYMDSIPEETRPDWRVFATKVDGSRKAQRNIFADLMEKHEYPFLNTCISRSAAVDNALEYYKPVQKHRSGSPVASDYMELAREVMGLFGEEAVHGKL